VLFLYVCLLLRLLCDSSLTRYFTVDVLHFRSRGHTPNIYANNLYCRPKIRRVSKYCSTAVPRPSGLNRRRGGTNNGGSPLPGGGVHRTSFLVSPPNPKNRVSKPTYKQVHKKQDRHCTKKRNTEARSRNYRCRGNAITNTLSESMSVALRYPACKAHASCLWPAWVYHAYFSTLFHKWHNFQEKKRY
jgi:hypothetical protein